MHIKNTYTIGLISLLLIVLSGCCNNIGNVVPQKGPTMEDVYDSMPEIRSSSEKMPLAGSEAVQYKKANDVNSSRVNIEATNEPQTVNFKTTPYLEKNKLDQLHTRSLHKLANPELNMYVFPHLAGEEEVRIPGYFTEFNAYEKDHYSLPIEERRIA